MKYWIYRQNCTSSSDASQRHTKSETKIQISCRALQHVWDICPRQTKAEKFHCFHCFLYLRNALSFFAHLLALSLLNASSCVPHSANDSSTNRSLKLQTFEAQSKQNTIFIILSIAMTISKSNQWLPAMNFLRAQTLSLIHISGSKDHVD